MKIQRLRSSVVVLAFAASTPYAIADEGQATKQTTKKATKQSTDKKTLDTQQTTKLSQQAMTHIAAAQRALDSNNKTAAQAALSKSEQALDKLYDTPAHAALLNELDEAINGLAGKQPALEPIELAPIGTSVRSTSAYVDPEVSAGVKRAQEKAKQGDAKGAEEELRLARHRVAMEVALLPVEEAYVRVMAAQRALQTGDKETASRLLRNVPIVVSEVLVTRPLVPIRFKLHTAAEAAEANQLERARTLLTEVDRELQQLETASKNTELAPELAKIADDVEQLTTQIRGGTQPDARKIREIAQRTRTIGMEGDGDRG